MDLDPMQFVEDDDEKKKIEKNDAAASRARLNTWVAISVAVLATFMGICKVKDDNVVQAMQQAQADKLDHWAFYQARNIRQQMAESTADQLELARAGAPAATAAGYDAAIAKHRALAEEQAQKKEELKRQAE